MGRGLRRIIQKGVKYYLDADEMAALNSRNDSHTADEPIKDLIDTAYNWIAPKPLGTIKAPPPIFAFGQVCKTNKSRY